MVIAIIGSRSFGSDNNDHKACVFISNFINGIFSYSPLFNLYDDNLTIISGGAIGADTFVENACKREDRLSQFKKYLPNLSTYGYPKAYHVRNDLIISKADKVVAFWNGSYVRSGTASVIRKAIKARKKLMIFKFEPSFGLFAEITQKDFVKGKQK
jgi:hypothetical protein